MAKIANHTFILDTKDGHKYHFESEVHVCSEGEFSCTVPDFLIPTLNAVARLHNKRLYTSKLRVNHRAYAPSKSELIGYVNQAHHDFYKAEEIVELVICYDWFSEVSYFIRPDGSICENGSAPGAAFGAGGQWANNQGRDGRDITGSGGQVGHFSVGVFAAIFKRTTFRRSSGDTIEYERVWANSVLPSEMPWAHRLKGLCGLKNPKEPRYLKQMPLTDEAARFFYESMMAMCEIGRRFSNFFGDEDNILAAIEGRGPSLLSGPTPHVQPTIAKEAEHG